MKRFLFALIALVTFSAKGQEYYFTDEWGYYATNKMGYAFSYQLWDTSRYNLYVDTIDFTEADFIYLPGTSSQYVKGDGSFATFPAIPDVSGKVNVSDTAFMLAPYISVSDTASMLAPYITSEVDGSVTNEIELPSQTGNSGKVLTTNGTSPSWTTVKRQETYSGSTNSSGEYTVTFSTAYSTAPNIQAQIVGGNSNQVLTVTSVSTTGFTVKVVEKQTTTLLGIVVLQNNTTNSNGTSVHVLITEQ